MRRVGLVTCREFPDLSEDDRPLLAEFAARGWDPAPVVWDGSDWNRFDLLILRSCWDYHLKIDEFKAWLDGVESRGIALLNPPDLVRWNLHKSYLAELQQRGVTTPRTIWLKKGTTVDVGALLEKHEWNEAVVKPAVSAGAWETHRVKTPDTISAPLDLMIQEFLPEVLEAGELSMIFIGGAFSHAVRKFAKRDDFKVGVEHGGKDSPASPGGEIIRQAQRALDGVSSPWLYARVDGIERSGAFLLTELELIEPFLFFKHNPGGPSRFAAAAVELFERQRR